MSEVDKLLRLESEKEDTRYVPVRIARPLLEECGYRCAIPTCRGTSALQLEHIEDWAKLDFKKHDFDKMIVLCATCHARVTSKEIHKSAVKAYKRNLAVINGRYSLFEMRVLEALHDDGPKAPIESPTVTTVNQWILVAYSDQFHLKGLIDDGIINFTGNNWGKEPIDHDFPNRAFLNLTPSGVQFVNDYFSGKEIS